MNIGIIGAGALGLAAAYELTKKGHKVAVFERAPFVGGQASTFDIGGGRLERGYHHLFTSDVDMVHLIHEIGLGPKLKWIESKAGFLYDGKIYPFVTPGDLLRFSPLPFADRLRMGFTMLYLQRQKDWRKYEPVTAKDWISKYAGKNVYNVVWGPLLRAKFGSTFDQVSMAWYWGKIQLRFASRQKGMSKEVLGYPIGSFGEIFETLADKIKAAGGEINLGSGVTKIITESGTAVGLEVQTPNGMTTPRRFDQIIATVPSYVFPRLIEGLPQDYLDKLNYVKYQAAVLIVLALKQHLSPIYWLTNSDPQVPFVAVIEQSNFVSPDLYGGLHPVYLSNYVGRESPYYSMKGEELLEAYMPSLKRINPQFDRSWIAQWWYHREDAAQPIITTDFTRHVPELRTPIKNLILANTTQIYPEDRGTNYSVRLGRLVARMLDPRVEMPVKAVVKIGIPATEGLH